VWQVRENTQTDRLRRKGNPEGHHTIKLGRLSGGTGSKNLKKTIVLRTMEQGRGKDKERRGKGKSSDGGGGKGAGAGGFKKEVEHILPGQQKKRREPASLLRVRDWEKRGLRSPKAEGGEKVARGQEFSAETTSKTRGGCWGARWTKHISRLPKRARKEGTDSGHKR